MAVTLDGSNVTYSDSTVQNTAAVITGQNLSTGNGAMFADKSGANLRFKRLAISGTFSVANTGTTITLTYTGGSGGSGGGDPGAVK